MSTKKKLSPEALAYGKERRAAMSLTRKDGTPRTQAELDFLEGSFAAEKQRALDEGYTMSTNWQDIVMKIDYWGDGTGRQHKRNTNVKYGLSISGVGTLEEVDKIPDELLFDVSFCDGVHYQPLFEGIPGSVIKDCARHEESYFGNNYDGSGPYLVIKRKAIPTKYKYKVKTNDQEPQGDR